MAGTAVVGRLRLFRFMTVGIGAALVFFVLSYLLRRHGTPAFIASTSAYAIAFAMAYSAQHGWTFAGKHNHSRAFPRYLVAQLVCGLVSGVVAHVTADTLQTSPFVMSLAAMITAGATSYVLSSLWVFPAPSQRE